MLGFFCSFCFDYIRSNNVASDRLLFQEMLLLVSLGILFKGGCRFQYVDDLFHKVFWTIVSGLNARLYTLLSFHFGFLTFCEEFLTGFF